MSFFGLGKSRSRFGKWLDRNRISQEEIAALSGVHRNIVSRLANEDSKPSWRTEKKLIRAMRQYDIEVSAEDFWE